MNKEILLKNIKALMTQHRKNNYDMATFITMQKTFDEYLNLHPKDTKIWLSYAMCMYTFAEGTDYPANCLRKILEYDPGNLYATMLLVYIAAHDSHIDDQLFKQLCNLKTTDKEIVSMIEYEKIWYYYDDEDCKKVLINSIELSDKHLWNNVTLGRLYIGEGRIKEGQELMKKGLKNVKLVYTNDTEYDELSVEEYFNENIKGVHITDINYNIIIDSFDPNYYKPIMDLINKHLNQDSKK